MGDECRLRQKGEGLIKEVKVIVSFLYFRHGLFRWTSDTCLSEEGVSPT